MNRTYYSLLVRESRRWSVQFGDYDRETLDYESQDLRDKGTRAADIKIITTDGMQKSIDAVVAKLNGVGRVTT